jgi:hypothetical protein
VATLGAAAGVVVGEPWRGPVLLSLSTGHGMHAGNLAALPLVALAFLIGCRGSPALRSVAQPIRTALSRRWVGPAAAVTLGVLLFPAAIVDLPHRGSMVPSGGGTIDGELLFVAGRSANPIGVWSYVAMTYDGSRLRLFVDGHQAASRPTTGPVATARNPLWFGGNHPFGEFFEGLIDEARVYDRALSDAEIRADMEKSVASGGAVRGRANAVAGPRAASRRAAGLVAAYAFDEGAGASVADGSGNGNGGTVTGATWTRGRYGSALRRPFPAAAVMILVGCVMDAVVAPSVTLFAPTLLAVWFALSADDGAEAAVGWLVTCVLTLVTAASLADLAGVGTRMQRDDGGLARSAALGVTLVAIGLVMLRRARPSRREPAAWAPPAG